MKRNADDDATTEAGATEATTEGGASSTVSDGSTETSSSGKLYLVLTKIYIVSIDEAGRRC